MRNEEFWTLCSGPWRPRKGGRQTAGGAEFGAAIANYEFAINELARCRSRYFRLPAVQCRLFGRSTARASAQLRGTGGGSPRPFVILPRLRYSLFPIFKRTPGIYPFSVSL